MNMTRVKICGIKSIAEAGEAVRLGAWAIGEVFAPSKRQIDADAAAAINRQVQNTVLKIGVFVNEDIDTLCSLIRYCSFDLVQLHGDESPEYVQEIPVPVVKSFPVSGPLDVEEVRRWPARAYLFDTGSESQRGGSGRTFDWQWLDTVKGKIDIILAGGLNSSNVGRAIHQVHPMAVDVSSGVEYSGGGKDPLKIKEFIQAVKEADEPDRL